MADVNLPTVAITATSVAPTLNQSSFAFARAATTKQSNDHIIDQVANLTLQAYDRVSDAPMVGVAISFVGDETHPKTERSALTDANGNFVLRDFDLSDTYRVSALSESGTPRSWAQFRYTQTVTDASGNGRTGTVCGTPTLVTNPFAGSPFAYAIRGDGVDRQATSDAIKLYGVDLFTTGPWTIEGEFTRERIGTGAYEVIVGRIPDLVDDVNQDDYQLVLYLDGPSDKLAFASHFFAGMSSGTVSLGAHKYAVTWDLGMVYVHLDDVLVFSYAQTFMHPLPNSTAPLQLMKWWDGAPLPLQGAHGRFRVSNIARYTGGTSAVNFANDANTVLLWNNDAIASIAFTTPTQGQAMLFQETVSTYPIAPATISGIALDDLTGLPIGNTLIVFDSASDVVLRSNHTAANGSFTLTIESTLTYAIYAVDDMQGRFWKLVSSSTSGGVTTYRLQEKISRRDLDRIASAQRVIP